MGVRGYMGARHVEGRTGGGKVSTAQCTWAPGQRPEGGYVQYLDSVGNRTG